MRIALSSSALLALTACDYEAPLSDRFATETPANVINGTVTAEGVASPTHAVVFVTDAASPMPPDGFGFPETFSTVRTADFVTVDASAGIHSAPFAVTNVPDGDWAVTGFLDYDNDFSALDSILASFSCGDVVGSYDQEGALGVVTTGGGQLTSGVTMALREEIVYERPSFTLEPSAVDGYPDNGADISLGYYGTDWFWPEAFVLQATPIHAEYAVGGLPLHLDYTAKSAADCQAGFQVILVDADGDGVVDDSPLDSSLKEAWPQLVLTYLGIPQDDGTFDASHIEEGVTWAGLALPHPIFLPAHPDGLLNAPFYVDTLEVAWVPGAQKINPDGSSEIILDLDQIPQGAWDITVLQPDGAFWYIPNSLANDGEWVILDDQPWDPARQGEYLLVVE